MPLDALHIKYATQELDSLLSGGRIDKITVPKKDLIRFAIFSNGKTHGLCFSLNPSSPFIRLTHKLRESLDSVPPFVSYLRKYILNATIKSISSLDNERIVKLRILSTNELKQQIVLILIFEFTGRHTNCFLVNEKYIISDCYKHMPLDSNSSRNLLNGLPYVPPPSSDKVNPFNTKELELLLKQPSSKDLFDMLKEHTFGISTQTIHEILFLAFGNSVPTCPLSKKNIDILQNTIKEFIDTKNYSPCVHLDKLNAPLDFYFTKFKSVSSILKSTATLLDAMEEFYSSKESIAETTELSKRLQQTLKQAENKLNKKMAILVSRKQDALKLDEDKVLGELIISNIYKIKKGDTELIVDNFYTTPPSITTIKLDSTLYPKQIAEKYFKTYKKKKRTLELIEPQITELSEELDLIASSNTQLALAKDLTALKALESDFIELKLLKPSKKSVKKEVPKSKKEKALVGITRVEFMGYSILTGKNNIQNDALVRHSKPNDLWLHPKEIRGSHTVIINPKKVLPPFNIIKKAASINALYSKAKLSENVPIDYTFIKFVSRVKGAALGKVIYTNQKTIFVSPEKLSDIGND